MLTIYFRIITNLLSNCILWGFYKIVLVFKGDKFMQKVKGKIQTIKNHRVLSIILMTLWFGVLVLLPFIVKNTISR